MGPENKACKQKPGRWADSGDGALTVYIAVEAPESAETCKYRAANNKANSSPLNIFFKLGIEENLRP